MLECTNKRTTDERMEGDKGAELCERLLLSYFSRVGFGL